MATTKEEMTICPAVCLPCNFPCVRCRHKGHGSSFSSPGGETHLQSPWASMGSSHRLQKHRQWRAPDPTKEWVVVVKVKPLGFYGPGQSPIDLPGSHSTHLAKHHLGVACECAKPQGAKSCGQDPCRPRLPQNSNRDSCLA